MKEPIKHKVVARHSRVIPNSRLSIPLIKRAAIATLEFQDVEFPCEVSVLITDDRSIHELNRRFRSIDAPTDVLSFPMLKLVPTQSLTLIGSALSDSMQVDPESGLLPLGEIVLSAIQVAKQANEYGQSLEYETAYLTVHSVLHLLGYDHEDEGDGKKKMRDSEKAVMSCLGEL